MPMSREGSNGSRGEPMRQFAAIIGVKAGQNFQQRGLAAARWADQCNELSRRHVEGHLGDREKIFPRVR